METSVRAFETCEPSYTGRPAWLFFIFEGHAVVATESSQ
jgi:hypothetical protein